MKNKMLFISAFLLIGCGPDSHRLSNGAEIILNGQTSDDYSYDFIFMSLQAAQTRLSERYLRNISYDGLFVYFHNQDDYYLSDGRKVAGHTDWSGNMIYVGANKRRLWESSFIHELVHALDIRTSGTTDTSHISWKESVYPLIINTNSEIERLYNEGR